MDTRRIWPEIVLAGFLHLVWVVFLLVNIGGGTLPELVNILGDLQTGVAALLGSAIIGSSFLIGLLTNRLLVFLSEVLFKANKEDELNKALQNAPHLEVALEDRSAHKALFRSASTSVPLITATLIPWACHHSNSAIIWLTVITGIILTATFVVAFITQRSFHQRLFDSMLGSTKIEEQK